MTCQSFRCHDFRILVGVSVGVPLNEFGNGEGARVIGTASGLDHIKVIRDLGCDQAIDYTATRFVDRVRDLDVVLDLVGADSQERSFGVLKKGGILVALTEEQRQDLDGQNSTS